MSFQNITPHALNQEPEPEGPPSPFISPRDVETPEEFKSVPEDFPALSQVEFSGPMLEDPMRGAGAGIVRWLRHIPPCIWVKNGSDEVIIVRVSKIKPDRILNQVNIEGSLTGARIGGEATVNVIVKYEGKVFVYTLKAGSLGVFRDPQSGVLECWNWQGESMDREHPALQQTSAVVMRGPPEHQ